MQKIVINDILPLVTVGMVTYNRTPTFRRALDSIINQTYFNLEIIIGDNSDNNETKNIIESEYVSDARIKYYKHPKNIGMARNAEFVRDKAKGKYFLPASDDDYWDITFIEKAVAKLESDNDAVACWPRFLYIGEGGIFKKSGEYDNPDLSGSNIVNNLVRYNMQPGWYEYYALYRLTLWKKFDMKQYKTTGTDVIITNLVLLSGKCLFIDEPLFFYSPSVTSAFDRYYNFELFNEYARINPYLDLFVKIFQEIFQTKRLYIFQKILFYFKLWRQILFKNRIWIGRFRLYPQKNFFSLAFKRKAFFVFLICLPFCIYKVVAKIKQKIFGKLLILKDLLHFLRLVRRRIQANTVLIIEPHYYHQEVVPGYAKYFVDLGYTVDIIMLPETKQDNVFCRYRDNNIHLHMLTLKGMIKYITLKRIYNYVTILITTYYPEFGKYCNQEFLEKMFYNTLFLLKQMKILCIHYLPSDFIPIENVIFVVLKDLYSALHKPLMVNPHFFGEPRITLKNKVTNFIVVGNKETTRRNYSLLIDTSEKLINNRITNFHIILVGSGNITMKQSLENYFTILGHINFSTLFQYLEQADFILALLDPENSEHDDYVDRKTSGTFQLSYGFLKPIILCKKFAKGTGFTNENALIYKDNSMFESVLQEAISMDNETYVYIRDNLAVLEKDISELSLRNLNLCLTTSSPIPSPPPPPLIHEVAFTVGSLKLPQFFKNEGIAA